MTSSSDDEPGERGARRPECEGDEVLSVRDQRASGWDQVAAESDRTASERDQALSDADQSASDRDQRAAERDLADGPPLDAARQHAHDLSQAERDAGTAQRAAIAALRTQVATERVDLAHHRDEASRLRDLTALARDRAADARDHLAAICDPHGPIAEARALAAADRAQAATDRARGAADREQAAIDRRQAHAALSQTHLDELTGTYRRGLGTLILQREVDRASRAGGGLVLTFIDVDGLKEVNDGDGHAAGDALLIRVARTIRSSLRSYDPVVRVGGDEFICGLSGSSLEDARLRFDQIQAVLAKTPGGASISVGFAELQPGDSLAHLTARGDAALFEAKGRERGTRFARERPNSDASAQTRPRRRRRFQRLTDLRHLTRRS